MAGIELFANQAQTTVSSGGTTAPSAGTSETWTVASSAGFPAASSTASPPTFFRVTDQVSSSEKMIVTNVSGTTWTVTRGAEGTSTVAHSSGFVVENVVTAASLGSFLQQGHIKFLEPSGDTTGAADSAAISAAMSALPAVGGVVTLAPGEWWTNAPVVIPAYSKLAGTKGNMLDSSGSGGTVINRASGWAQGGASSATMIILNGIECAVEGIAMHLQWPGSAIDGITGVSGAYNAHLRDVTIYAGANNGVTGNANGWRAENVMVAQAYSIGFYGVPTDSDYVDCIASACVTGWLFSGSINSRLIACRAEWNTGNGYDVSTASGSTGGMSMIGCSTDRNANYGIYVSGNGTAPVTISAPMLRRDGYNSTSSGYAGIAVQYNTTTPVFVENVQVFPGFNDDGSGNQSPQYGINVLNVGGTGTPTYVQVIGGVLHAVSAALNGTLNSTRGLVGRTGNWNGPSGVTPVTDTGGSFSGTLTPPAGTTTAAPLTLTSGTSLTTAAAGSVEYDGTCFYATAQASSRQVVDAEQLITLTSTYTLTSQTAAQKLFNSTTNGALTVEGSTTYFFECFFSLSSMSSTSGSFGFALGGTATLTAQVWETEGNKAALATAASAQNTVSTAANTAIVTATTNTVGWAKVWGKVRVNAAGTLIPQVSLGVAAAAVVGVDSYFRIWPAGASTITNVGDWS